MRSLKIIIWLAIFSIAMGYLETAVVVYLRKLCFPDGFRLPIHPLGLNLAATELFREAATIIMLIGAGILSGRNSLERFAGFLFCFGIWDIFYYVFLKVLLNWPATFMEWDLLFLIPAPWFAPVLAPCIVSSIMILLGTIVIRFSDSHPAPRFKGYEWLLFISGVVIIIISFTEDAIRLAYQGVINYTAQAIAVRPGQYDWLTFFIGVSMVVLCIISFTRRYITKQDLAAGLKSSVQ